MLNDRLIVGTTLTWHNLFQKSSFHGVKNNAVECSIQVTLPKRSYRYLPLQSSYIPPTIIITQTISFRAVKTFCTFTYSFTLVTFIYVIRPTTKRLVQTPSIQDNPKYLVPLKRPFSSLWICHQGPLYTRNCTPILLCSPQMPVLLWPLLWTLRRARPRRNI